MNAQEFAARWWSMRPGAVGVAGLTTGTVLVMAVTDWPAWGAALTTLGGFAIATAGFAALEAANEAVSLADETPQDVDDGDGDEGQPALRPAFAVDEPEEGRYVNLKLSEDES
ncbi:hypothetical protein [Streptosporangium jomthongense]|uniref:Uncharacterized protein n=1 Tax=Streptosporangium jomthongense TaxID=1193683 RepID=A0ABV8F6A8_9ACTN